MAGGTSLGGFVYVVSMLSLFRSCADVRHVSPHHVVYLHSCIMSSRRQVVVCSGVIGLCGLLSIQSHLNLVGLHLSLCQSLHTLSSSRCIRFGSGGVFEWAGTILSWIDIPGNEKMRGGRVRDLPVSKCFQKQVYSASQQRSQGRSQPLRQLYTCTKLGAYSRSSDNFGTH